MDHRHHRDLVHADQLAQGFRQKSRSAAGGIPGLRVHGQHIPPLQHLADGFDQVQIRGEFPGADGADPLQQKKLDHITVDTDHITQRMHTGTHGGQLKVDKMHMVTKHDVWRLQPLHADFLHLIFLADEGELGQHPNQSRPKFRLMHGITSVIVPLFVLIIHFNIHRVTSFRLNCKRSVNILQELFFSNEKTLKKSLGR